MSVGAGVVGQWDGVVQGTNGVVGKALKGLWKYPAKKYAPPLVFEHVFEYDEVMDSVGGSSGGVDATPVDHALDQLRVAMGHLGKAVEDGGLDHYDIPGLLGFVVEFERVRNGAALVDHRVVADCERRQVADGANARTTRALLADLLRISDGEAARRVRAAEAVGDRSTLQGL
ncbi:MAG: endonuclease, partial [Propionibacteriaceae bacterium]|nr:endonuclease [Propionibacteriaceae bacterium]